MSNFTESNAEEQEEWVDDSEEPRLLLEVLLDALFGFLWAYGDQLLTYGIFALIAYQAHCHLFYPLVYPLYSKLTRESAVQNMPESSSSTV